MRHGGITKAGDSALRSMLIVGATALLRHVRKGRHKPSPWLAALLERKPPKLVAVALANKFARIAWRLMVSGGVYNRPPCDADCNLRSAPTAARCATPEAARAASYTLSATTCRTQ